MEGKPVRIHLGGALGKAMGRSEWRLYVSSPAEAIRAIDANLGGKLREYLSTKGRNRYYKVALGNKENALGKEEIGYRSGQTDIYLIPTVKGAKSGFGKILAGIALVALAFISGGASLAATGFLGGFASTAALLGGSLILGGIVQTLTPTPNFNQDSVGDSRGSNILDGNATTVTQGGAVGLVYGRMLVTPMPISFSSSSFEQSAVNSFAPSTYDVTNGPGGIVNYVPNVPPITNNLPR